jgi:diguanylate cyclase (GGDEF)-like protein
MPMKIFLLLGFLLPYQLLAQDKTTLIQKVGILPTSISYCIDPSWHPYESIKNKKHIGISSELITMFQEHTGIKTELVMTKNWLETLEMLKNGQCDLTPALNKTTERSEYLLFSDIWYRAPNVMISLKDEPFLQGLENLGNRTVALIEGYRMIGYVKKHYPSIKPSLVANEIEGINAVINKDIDVFIGSILSINNYIQTYGYDQIKVAGWAGPEDLLRVGVSKNNKTLVPVLNEFIAQISETERINMFRKWNNVSFIDTTNYTLIKNISLFFSLLLIAGLLYSLLVRKLNKKLLAQNTQLQSLKTKLTHSNKELLFLTHHDLLTQVYNRHYFNQVINSHDEKFVPRQPVCLIFFDVDHFKSINDHFGHSKGDEVLKSIAQTIKSILTEQHTFVRWGGEEFIIMCEQTTESSAYKLSQQINHSLNQIDIQPINQITCSIGIAKLHKNEDILNCIERADHAMYQAKSNGRNQIICA